MLSSFRWCVSLTGCIAALIATPVSAQDVDERHPFAADRPGFNGPAAVVGPGAIQLELGWASTYDASHGDGREGPQPMLRVGVSNRLELQVVSGGLSASCAFDCPWQATDTAVGMRTLLTTQERAGVALAVTSLVSLPTGGDATTSGLVTPLIIVHADRKLTQHFELSVNYQWLHERVGDDPVRHGLGISVGYGVGAAIPFVNVARRPTLIDDKAPWLLESGLAFMLGRDVQLDVGVNRGINRPEDDWGVFGGVAIRRRPR